MDEKPDQIINHIEAQRDQLGRNLNELESRVRRSTDWRTHFDRNPMLVLGAALGGGLLLGAVVGSRHSGSTYYRSTSGGSSKSTSTASQSSGSRTESGHQPASYLTGRTSSGSTAGSMSHSQSQHIQQISQTLEHIKGAMIAFGIAKVKEFLADAVPGLDQHLANFTPSTQHSTGSQRPAANTGGPGSTDYRAGSEGYASSGSTGSTQRKESDEFVGSAHGRTPNINS